MEIRLYDQDEIGNILEEAFELYGFRDAKYKGLWKDGGAEDNAFHLRHKAMRVFRTFQDNVANLPPNGEKCPDFQLQEALVEDAMDIINYAAFYIYCVRNGMFRCSE